MASFVPSAEGLQQLLALFRASQSANNTQHRAIQQQLNDFNVIPEYNSYLAYILNQLKQEEGAVRQLAGLMLKNNVKEHWRKLTPEVQEYVRENLLGSLGDPQKYIRTTVGSCITTIIYVAGLDAWPTLVPMLYRMLDSPEDSLVDGALSALNKICEDSPDKLAKDVTSQPLHFLVPKFLTFFGHSQPLFRKYGVGCINHFVLLMPPALVQHMDQYLQGLFALATDPSPDVRCSVCQALVMLLDANLEKLAPHIPAVVQYMLGATADPDATVALEACEFWPAICETPIAQEALVGVLPQLIPVLLKGMVYSEEDIIFFDTDENNEAQPDRAEDVKPRFHKARVVAGSGSGSGSGEDAGAAGAAGAAEDGDDDDDDDYDDDDDDDDDDVSEWNLRKCSASGLDVLAGTFREQVLPTLLPMLQERLASPQWEVRESGILALGAIAEGCLSAIQAYLPQLVPWLVQTLADPKALIRSITCWTLSRYSK